MHGTHTARQHARLFKGTTIQRWHDKKSRRAERTDIANGYHNDNANANDNDNDIDNDIIIMNKNSDNDNDDNYKPT